MLLEPNENDPELLWRELRAAAELCIENFVSFKKRKIIVGIPGLTEK